MPIVFYFALYRLLWWFIAPYALLRLCWRARKERAYIQHIAERFGFQSKKQKSRLLQKRPVIWIHAVSVGETRATQPLVKALKQAYPNSQILMTHMTPGGRATSEAVYGDTIWRCYLPYDIRSGIKRFLKDYQPVIGILMETEIWPMLINECRLINMPLILANARMSERSFQRTKKFGKLAKAIFAQLSYVLAQDENDAKRLSALGVTKMKVIGNLKFDVTLNESLIDKGHQWRAAIGERPIFVAASTREGEEILILKAFKQIILTGHSNALLVLIPRHSTRFDDVFALAKSEWKVMRRSEWINIESDNNESNDKPENVKKLFSDIQILLGDSMGEMAAYYAMADIVFIGGSLMPLGGQNLIEAAAIGTPILFGPHMFNFSKASADALTIGAALSVSSTEQLANTVQFLFKNSQKRFVMREAALQFATQYKGATARTMRVLSEFI